MTCIFSLVFICDKGRRVIGYKRIENWTVRDTVLVCSVGTLAAVFLIDF